jgi:hypothetical protein
MEHRCPKCASSQLTDVREGVFAREWGCLHCGNVFVNPRLSVVFIDSDESRRERLVSCLTREGIPVAAASCVAELEAWPVGKVLVTHVASVTRFWFEIGAAHLIVLANSDEERELADRITRGRAAIIDGQPVALLTILRTIAEGKAAVPPKDRIPNRRTGPPERRRHPRRDRRS